MRAAARGTNAAMERRAEALLFTSLTEATVQTGMLSCLNITFLAGLQLPSFPQEATSVNRVGCRVLCVGSSDATFDSCPNSHAYTLVGFVEIARSPVERTAGTTGLERATSAVTVLSTWKPRLNRRQPAPNSPTGWEHLVRSTASKKLFAVVRSME